jgi:hypothetical protein
MSLCNSVVLDGTIMASKNGQYVFYPKGFVSSIPVVDFAAGQYPGKLVSIGGQMVDSVAGLALRIDSIDIVRP